MAPIEPTTERDARPRGTYREAALIAVLALVLNLAGNARTSLWDRDEPRYAGCTREMRASGDYIHPTFNAEPRYHKPILVYWLMLAGTAIGGENPFGARLVSAVMGVGTSLLVWSLGRRMLGANAGRLGALMLATAPIMVAESKLATTDATLLFFLVACQFALWELARADSKWKALTFWVSLALATLTKGPVGPAIVGVAGLVSWWWGGPVACWGRLRPKWGVPLYLLITAPWYVAIGIITRGEFYKVSMGYHVVRRMTTGIETHGGFPGYYVALSLVLFYPWAALMPAALLSAWVKRKADPAMGFLLGWVIGPLVMLELVRTKLIHYYLPAYPGAALLAAWLVVKVAASEVNLRRWPLGRMSMALFTGVGITLAVGLLALMLVVPGPLKAPCLVLAIVLGAGTLYAVERLQAGATSRAAYSLVATWALILWIGSAWLAPAADPYRLSPIVARRLDAIAYREHATPMLASFQAPGVVYGLGRPAQVMRDRADLVDRARRDGAVVAALSNSEMKVLSRDARLSLDPRDEVHGFNVEKAWNQSLRMVVIRPSNLAGRQQAGVK